MVKVNNFEKRLSNNIEETEKIAEELGKELKPNDVILLCGELGTGKTAFTSGLVKAFNLNNRIVSSPTFTLMNIYKGSLKIYHIDLYRLLESSDIFYEELEEVINSGGITIVEWGESFKTQVNEIAEGRVYLVNILRKTDLSREITIEKNINN